MSAAAQDTMPATERTMASVLSDIRSQEILPAELATLIERVLPVLEAVRAEAILAQQQGYTRPTLYAWGF